MRSCALLVCAVVVGASCGGAAPQLGFAVALTADFDNTVSDAAMARVTTLRFHATGDEDYSEDVPLTRAAQRAERTIYKPKILSRSISIVVVALDAGGAVVAGGTTGALSLVPDQTTVATAELSATPADGGAPDDSVPATDGGLDAGGDGSCPGSFCDNFDDRTALTTAWDDYSVTGSGDITNGSISTAEYVSSPHSAKFHSPAYTAGGGDGVWINVHRPLTAAHVSVDFDVKVAQQVGPFTGYINLVAYGAGGVPEEYAGGYTTLNTYESIDYLVRLADGGIAHPINAVPAHDGAWHHVHFEETFDRVNGSVYATWDNQIIFNDKGVLTWDKATPPTKFTLSIGAHGQATTAAIDVYFDNVVLK